MRKGTQLLLVGALVSLVSFCGLGLQGAHADASAEPAGVYEIYPTPHKIEYSDENTTVTEKVNVYFGKEIDEATENHLYDAFSLLDVLAYENGGVSDGTDVYVGVYNSGDKADVYARSGGVDIPAELFENNDAYVLSVRENAIVVLGKDTDAAFYGITTLLNVFEQIEGREVRQFDAFDYSDCEYRGFIEGYYGFPWSSENRIELMNFGSKFKTNIYIYAPKDDPYHSSNWRGLYTDRDLEAIKEEIAAGAKTKTRFAWSVHPFLSDAMTAENYESSLTDLLNKFQQLYDVGVRQFVVSADDISTAGLTADDYVGVGELHKTLLNDVSEWLREKGDCYDLIFVPSAYCNRAFASLGGIDGEKYFTGLMRDLDETVEIMWTGDKICSRVSNGRFDVFANYTNGRKAFMWLNWPVNDFDTSRLTLGKGEPLDFVATEEEEAGFTGIVTNPLERAEASKLAIFAVADYCWNLNGFDMDRSYDDSFKYVERTATEELKEICSHLTTTGEYDGGYFEESEIYKEDIAAFLAQYKAGEDYSETAQSLLDKLAYTSSCCESYLEKASNVALKEEILPWIKALDGTCKAAAEYLRIALNAENVSGEALVEKVEQADALYAAATGVTIPKLNSYNPVYVKVSRYVLSPFLEELQALVSDEVKLASGIYTGLTVRGFEDIYEGSIENIADGDESTFVWFGSYPQLGSFVRIDLGETVRLENIRVLSGNATGGDVWTGAKIEYSSDGKTYASAGEIVGVKTVCFLQEPVSARYIRIIETDEKHPTWVAIKEVSVNTDAKVSGTVTTDIEYASGESTSTDLMLDGDIDTFTWFAAPVVGSHITLDLKVNTQIENVRLLMTKPSSIDDYISKTKLEYSPDGTVWTEIGEYTKRSIYVTLSAPVTARYIRATAVEVNGNGLVVRDFSVNNDYAVTVGEGFSPYDYMRDGVITYFDYAADGDENTYLDLASESDDTDRTITLRLGESTAVENIYVLSGGLTWADTITRMEVYYSADGVTYSKLGEYADENGVFEIELAQIVQAKYIRLNVLSTGWVTLREFSVNR